jgi:hypothetical protein
MASACGGNKNGGGTGAGAVDAYQADGKSCSEKLVNEGKQLTCTVNSVEDAKACRAKLVAFGEKYKGVVCNSLDENGKIQTVDISAKVNDAVSKIDKALAQLPNGG